MVQRKVPNKLGIQADNAKSEKRLGNLKPSSCQHQDGKNRGPDLKKKMKKSRSFKLSDIESFRSSSLKKNISLPGKPPPLNAPTSAATPQKQSPMKATDGSPNYMKSTSSSAARKERTQVSSQKTRTASDSKNRHQRNSSTSKLSSASGNKPARALTRSSSLKMVRTLTKTPSFKPVRALAKKCSRVVLCADMDAQRATCSSTLKDSKFPPYLMLNPGGTEAEGTSAMKVCPYTYCSLNGHHHAPLPPLKCFLSARRHSLKTQKSLKLGALSPRKAKLIGDGTKENDTSQAIFDDKPAYKEPDLGNSATSPLIQEVGTDFFIEIYAKSQEDDVEATGKSTQCDDEKINDSAKEVHDATVEHGNDKQVAESLSDGSLKSEIDFEDNFDPYSDFMSIEMDITKGFSEEQMVEDANEDYPAPEEVSPGSLFNGSNIEGECQARIEEDDAISEATDMEWEEGQFSAPDSDSEANYPTKNDNEPVIKNPVTRTDDIVSNNEEISANEALQQVYEEESACFDAPCNNSDSEMDGTHQDGEILGSSQVSNGFRYDQLSSTMDAFEELITTEEKGEETETDLTTTMITSASMEEPIVEPTAVSEEIQEDGVPETENEISEADTQIEVAENNCATGLAAEPLNDQDEDKSIQDDDAAIWLQNQISDSSQNFKETKQFETNEDYNERQTQEDSETDQSATISDFGLEQVLPNGEAGDRMDDTKVDDNPKHQMTQPFQLDDIAENSYSSCETVDDSLAAETQDDPSDGQYESFDVFGNQNISEKDEDESKKFKIPSSLHCEEQSNTRMCKISLADHSSEDVDTMEIEDNTKADTAETYLATKDAASPISGSTFFYARSNSNQEMPNTSNTLKWTIGRKRPTAEDCGELRKFNPREPNYLPMVPDPDTEKVDLRHQMMDERKNAEEWMLDHALQQAVTKLAPARKRKVALLVEAFETVIPIPKYETHLRHTSAAFAHARPIQACR